MQTYKGRVLFIAHNLTSSGGIESVSRMIADNQIMYGIVKIIDLDRKVNNGFGRYLSRLKVLPKFFQILIHIRLFKVSVVLVSHVAIAQILHPIFRRTKILVLCHGGEVWQNKKLAKLAASPYIYWLAVSEFTKCKMKQIALPKTKFTNEISNLHLTSPLFRNINSITYEKIPYSFLCVSRLDKSSRYKGVDSAIQIFSRIVTNFPKAKLCIVGIGNDQKYYSQLISELKLENCVEMKGFLTLEKLQEEYLKSQFFLLPGRPTITPKISEGEGFGIVFIEASFFGAIPIGGLGDGAESAILQNSSGLLVNGFQIELATEEVLHLMQNESRVQDMMLTGKDFVHSNHSHEQFSADIINALDRI